LQSNLLTPEEYTKAISAEKINPFMQGIARQVDGFNFDCEMLVCGFDSTKKPQPFIHYAVSKGLVDNMARTGFQAIGSGWPYVHARLLWSEYERKNDIGHVLYDLFDAKASAEMDPNVGYEWDAAVILLGKLGAYAVPEDIKNLVEQVWEKTNRSPFKKRDPKKDLPNPPRDWKEKLLEFSDSMLKASLKQPTKLKRLC
jgi:hypothetical protein